MLLHPSTLKVSVITAVIFVAGLVVGGINHRLKQTHDVQDLIRDAEIASTTFDASELDQLSGTRSDVGTPAYERVKRRLQNLSAIDPRIRYVYLFRVGSDPSRVIFLADSAEALADDESLPGDPYPEAPRSPGLQQLIRTGQPSWEGPLRDGFGVWVTGYAAVRRQAPGGRPADVLGIDVGAADWARGVWFAAARAAVYTWILIGFPVYAFWSTRRQGEQREAIRNLSEAVEQSHSAIMILDLDHRIEYANRGLSQQIGYSRRDLIGRHWREIFGGDSAGTTLADMAATVRLGRAWEGEWTNWRKDGTSYPVHGMVSPVKHRDGSLACFVAIFDDVTDSKRKEAELRDARDQAEAGDRAKGQFLATMSHEVRTPLNGIVGFTTLLLDTPLTDEQREFVHTIHASGEALIQLTGDILDFARIESGKLKLDPIACDPRECIEEALDLHATKAAEKGIDLLHRAADNVPAAVVVDGGRLRQVLINLIGNAVKFTESGEVEITVSAVAPEHAQSGGGGAERCVLEFRIRDTGIGIAPAQHARLFKPFSQLDETSTRRYGGAGLGLAISRNLVHLMGGDIMVTSTPGQGSTFSFTIDVPVAAPHVPHRELGGLPVALAVQAGALRRELVELLEHWGAVVTAAGPLAEVATGEWEVALVEVGEDFARALAAKKECLPGVPPEKAVALVPISLSSDLRAALRTHFRLVVNRPVHHGPLFALLSGSRPSGPGGPGPATQFGFRVLVVEDNPVNQRLVQRVLASFGCTSVVVENGTEAVSTLSHNGDTFDLVLLDLHMPQMDGLSALELIRRGDAGPKARTIWTVALTADARPEQRARGFATGLDDYLTKPLRSVELEEALRRYRSERLARKS